MNALANTHQQALLTYLDSLYEEKKSLLSFADFMNAALYAPGLGYYSAGSVKLGLQGDFVTAPEISPFFSQCVAHQCIPILQMLNTSDAAILELGAGTGRMAADILLTLAHHDQLPAHYFILEVSADLKARQQAYLKQAVPAYFDRIHWLSSLEDFSFSGILLANEVIDALPVHLFQVNDAGQFLEGRVIKKQEQWELCYDKPISEGFLEGLNRLSSRIASPLPSGYSSEILLSLPAWIRSLADCLQQGIMLFMDYGFPAHEYYHPDRHMGTLMCHTRHRAHADPMLNIGLQDITAHVDFTALRDAGTECGLTVTGFTTQAAFLLSNGLIELAQQAFSDDLKHNIQQSQQIQTLTAPHEMGELVKVMALSKDLTLPLQGFNWRDYQYRL